MFNNLRILLLCDKLLNQLEKIPMSLSMSTFVSLLNWGGQAALQLSGLITSAKWRTVAVAVSVIVGQVLKVLAFYNNPDGTPAQTRWQGGISKASVPKLPMALIVVLILGSAGISRAQVAYTLAAGATGFLSNAPHSGGIADFGILPSPTSRFSNLTEATVRPIAFKQSAFEILSGVETVAATGANLELSILVLVGAQNGTAGTAAATSQDGRLKWYPGFMSKVGGFFSLTGGGIETSSGKADPHVSFMVGMTLSDIGNGTTLATRRAKATKGH